ncbi:MAG TPA: hypothetical protein VLH85_07755 [Levilinea sp.]|nr:hypothetical protein [Levilinea sp.]
MLRSKLEEARARLPQPAVLEEKEETPLPESNLTNDTPVDENKPAPPADS